MSAFSTFDGISRSSNDSTMLGIQTQGIRIRNSKDGTWSQGGGSAHECRVLPAAVATLSAPGVEGQAARTAATPLPRPLEVDTADFFLPVLVDGIVQPLPSSRHYCLQPHLEYLCSHFFDRPSLPTHLREAGLPLQFSTPNHTQGVQSTNQVPIYEVNMT
jgi:hypothetical protein